MVNIAYILGDFHFIQVTNAMDLSRFTLRLTCFHWFDEACLNLEMVGVDAGTQPLPLRFCRPPPQVKPKLKTTARPAWTGAGGSSCDDMGENPIPLVRPKPSALEWCLQAETRSSSKATANRVWGPLPSILLVDPSVFAANFREVIGLFNLLNW
jgi:hypothetical protein